MQTTSSSGEGTAFRRNAVAGLVLPSLGFVVFFNLISIFPALLHNLLLLHFSVLLSRLPKDEHFQNSHTMELLSSYFFYSSLFLSYPTAITTVVCEVGCLTVADNPHQDMEHMGVEVT